MFRLRLQVSSRISRRALASHAIVLVGVLALCACREPSAISAAGTLDVAPDATASDLDVSPDASASELDVSPDAMADEDAGDAESSEGGAQDGDAANDGPEDALPADGNLADAEISQPDVLPKPCTSTDNCDDGQFCTIDSCTPLGCQHTVNPACQNKLLPCNDSNPCEPGFCDPASNACVECLKHSDCGLGHVCQDHQCLPGQYCKFDSDCKKLGKVCLFPAVCVDCRTNADCASGEVCIDSTCAQATPCKVDADCPKACDLASGVCVACLHSSDCAANQFCDTTHRCRPDVCDAPVCGNSAEVFACKPDGSGYLPAAACEDGNPCTTGSCLNGACGQDPTPGSCDDANPCTVSDACANGACSGSPKSCDDANPCTNDGCAGTIGCVHAPKKKGFPCDDGNGCTTNDACSNEVCVGTGLNCDDGNLCTDDSCTLDKGCANVANGLSCAGDTLCTAVATCTGGDCVIKSFMECDDGNACTDDTCTGGCIHAAVKDGINCTDGNVCTFGDTCQKGSCKPGATPGGCDDWNPCTVDACVPANGYCVSTPANLSCDDGDACTELDVCQGGVCKPGPPTNCDDGNPCTADGPCEKAKGGCAFSGNDKASCVTNSACTVGDHCQSGVCVGIAVACDDKNACTVDWCDWIWGCQHHGVPNCQP